MGKKIGRPKEKRNGIHHTCMSFDKEVFEKFKELSKTLNKKSITAFLEDLLDVGYIGHEPMEVPSTP